MWYDRLSKNGLGGWMFVVGGLVALCLVIPSFSALLGLAAVVGAALMVIFLSVALIFSGLEMLLPRLHRSQSAPGLRRELA